MFRTNRRSSFDKAGEERTYQHAQFAAMKHQLTYKGALYTPRQEIGRIYVAVVLSGAAILLMILAEMKFFGT
jgi:hypothetical protein